MNSEHLLVSVNLFKVSFTFSVSCCSAVCLFVCLFKEGRCNDVTIASTGLRSIVRTDIPDSCTRVMFCIFAMVNLQLH